MKDVTDGHDPGHNREADYEGAYINATLVDSSTKIEIILSGWNFYRVAFLPGSFRIFFIFLFVIFFAERIAAFSLTLSYFHWSRDEKKKLYRSR